MTKRTRIDPVDLEDLFELSLTLRGQGDEAEQNAALLAVSRALLKWERDRATKKESK